MTGELSQLLMERMKNLQSHREDQIYVQVEQAVAMEAERGEISKMKPLGKSLLVPSVKELIMSNSSQRETINIPPRYIQSEPLDLAMTLSDRDLELPIVDMEALIRGDPAELRSLQRVVNHGIRVSLIEKFKMEVEGFFDLPMETKKEYWQREDEIEGFGQAFVLSEDQKLDWADIFFATTLPKDLQKPHLLPMLPPSFRETLEDYTTEVQSLSMQILDCMAESLGKEEDKGFLRDMFGETARQSIRINYYPPCPEPEKVMGTTAHSDSAGLTILLQTNDMVGLQIKKDGSWISVSPIPHAFIVNIGDILEIMSNGEYPSVEHRAVVNSVKERISIAAFHTPGLEEEFGPARCLIALDNPPRFQRIKMADYLRRHFARKVHGKSYLEELRIQ